MIEPYTKLACSILDSSIWDEDDATVRIWITLLAMKDKNGIVHAAITGVARRANKCVEETERAIAKFEAPDPRSKNPANEGRRIRRVQGGFLVLNHEHYRNTFSVEENREYERVRKAEQRRKKTQEELDCPGHVPNVPDSPACPGHVTDVPQSDHIISYQIKDRESTAVELPPNFPKTVVEAVALCGAQAIPASFIEQTWHKAASRGGHDAKDVPIRSWQSYVASEWAFERNRVAHKEQKAKAPASTGMDNTEKILRAKELDRVEERMKAIRQSYDSHQSWTVEDKGEYRKLRERREILKKMLGLTV